MTCGEGKSITSAVTLPEFVSLHCHLPTSDFSCHWAPGASVLKSRHEAQVSYCSESSQHTLVMQDLLKAYLPLTITAIMAVVMMSLTALVSDCGGTQYHPGRFWDS